MSGHYDKNKHFSPFSFRGLLFTKKKFKKIDALVRYIRKLGKKYDVDASQIAVIWGRTKGIIPIVGIRRKAKGYMGIMAVCLFCKIGM